jgi:hypothetical protein
MYLDDDAQAQPLEVDSAGCSLRCHPCACCRQGCGGCAVLHGLDERIWIESKQYLGTHFAVGENDSHS